MVWLIAFPWPKHVVVEKVGSVTWNAITEITCTFHQIKSKESPKFPYLLPWWLYISILFGFRFAWKPFLTWNLMESDLSLMILMPHSLSLLRVCQIKWMWLWVAIIAMMEIYSRLDLDGHLLHELISHDFMPYSETRPPFCFFPLLFPREKGEKEKVIARWAGKKTSCHVV